MLGKRQIEHVGCWGCGHVGMWDIGDVEYWGCWVLEIWDVGDVGCLGCAMFGMWDVQDVVCSRCRMLIYKMPRVCEGFLFWSALKNWLWQYVLFQYFNKTFLKEHIFIEVVVWQSSTFQIKLPHVSFSRYFQNNYF